MKAILRIVATALAVSLWTLGVAADEDPATRAPIELDARQRQLAGLTYGLAERRAIEKTIRAVGRLDYDERKLAAVTLRVGGYVEKLFADYTGKEVRKGEPLLTIYSPELVSAEEEYVLAMRNENALAASKVPGVAGSTASLRRAGRERLLLAGLTELQIRDLEKAGKPSFHRAIVSPVSGVVLEKMVVAGQSVAAGTTLYRVADLSTIWVYADVHEYELPFVKVGQTASIRLSHGADRPFEARVRYIHPTLDPKTRTVKVRFELPNSPDRALRPAMFADVEIHVSLGERLVVAKNAVLDSGRRRTVFVAGKDGRFTPRDVEVGDRGEDWIEIRSGLEPGERVVTSANFLVDSESQLAGAESMMGAMGAVGMGDWKMESARPMTMGGGGSSEEQEKRVADLVVGVRDASDRTKPGDTIRIRLRDEAGAPVRGAKVSFTYTMDMPGMTIESVEARELGEGVYEGPANLTMSGPWGVVVQIERRGKSSVRENFTVRVAR